MVHRHPVQKLLLGCEKLRVQMKMLCLSLFLMFGWMISRLALNLNGKTNNFGRREHRITMWYLLYFYVVKTWFQLRILDWPVKLNYEPTEGSIACSYQTCPRPSTMWLYIWSSFALFVGCQSDGISRASSFVLERSALHPVTTFHLGLCCNSLVLSLHNGCMWRTRFWRGEEVFCMAGTDWLT